MTVFSLRGSIPCRVTSLWAPDPLMVGIRSPIGLVVGSCTSHPGVLGSIPKREEPGKTGATCVKVPGSSRVPAPPWVGSRPPWSFGFDSQTRGTRVLVRDGQTSPRRPRLVVSCSTCPPLSFPPHANSFVIGPAVIKHTLSDDDDPFTVLAETKFRTLLDRGAFFE